MSEIIVVLIAIVALTAGGTVGYLLRGKILDMKIRSAQTESERILKDAGREAKRLKKEALIEAREAIYKEKASMEEEFGAKRRELDKLENRLIQREENLDKKQQQLEEKETEIRKEEVRLRNMEKELMKQEAQLKAKQEEAIKRIEKIAHISREDAKKELIQMMEKEAQKDAYELIKKIEEKAREEADRKARSIIAQAIQRYAADEVAEHTVSVVTLPSDEMKGRIIGREGRNIRAFEAATGVDLIIDDTPEAVVLSCHDSVRREVAKKALEKLVKDGRIHPARIEEVVNKVSRELEISMKEAAEAEAFELGIHNLHPELIKLLGRLKYRTSYTQNMLSHSKEVAYFCSIMGAELGLDVPLLKRMGFLHDIGKAVDHEIEGSHAQIGADLARKYGENPNVVNAIASHHGEVEPTTPEAVVLAAADALSAARPGARKEMVEAYIKRIEKLEEISHSFPGVDKAFAIQAGREIRIIVKPQDISDSEIYMLARNIAKRLEEALTYPGQIKVHVIRESRAVEYAK
jgi:ribonuclease Y